MYDYEYCHLLTQSFIPPKEDNMPTSHSSDILFVFRNFKLAEKAKSHIGLGVNALHTLNVLKRMGYSVNTLGVWLPTDLINYLDTLERLPKICVIEAPWIDINNTLEIISRYPSVEFIVRCHSNANFLQVESGAVHLIREIMLHGETSKNLVLAGNSLHFCNFMEKVYHGRCEYLPNLYNFERSHTKRWIPFTHGQTLKVGSFGAVRIQKGHIIGATTALLLARNLSSPLEFYMTVNREENTGSAGVVAAINNLFVSVPWARFIQLPWNSWSIFRRHVAEMNLCAHLSSTETFSLVTADALGEGVGVVGSPVLEWIPPTWRCINTDNSEECASIGQRIISDHNTPNLAKEYLSKICSSNEKQWDNFLRRHL